MIIIAIIALSGVVLVALYAALNGLPSFPSSIMTTVNYMAQYLGTGASFIYSFVYPSVIQALLAITVTVESIVLGYKFVMWIAKKIPMFGVSD